MIGHLFCDTADLLVIPLMYGLDLEEIPEGSSFSQQAKRVENFGTLLLWNPLERVTLVPLKKNEEKNLSVNISD